LSAVSIPRLASGFTKRAGYRSKVRLQY
jgi:hypothetical protein